MSPYTLPEPGSIEARLLGIQVELGFADSRSGTTTMRDMVLPTAILLFLRWLEHDEAEQAAVAIFEGREHTTTLPGELSWQVLKSKRGKKLAGFFDEVLLTRAHLRSQGPSREKHLREVVQPNVGLVMAHTYGQAIRQLALAWPKLQELPERVRDALMQLVDDLPFERLEDRQQGEQLLAAMIREGATGRSAFYMPQAAADLMIEVARPQPGERIYDPCFGSGNLLVTAARRLREESSRFPARQWEDIQRNSLFGVDHYPHYYFVGLVRVILAGIEHPGLELGDVLQRPRIRNLSREGFDCILAVPPWRKLERGYSGSGSVDIPTTSSEGLFLQHIAASLRPGGRAVVALPASFLSSAGSEKRVRKMLLEDFRVEGVIGLPANVFKPYTNTESSLLVFSREKPAEVVRFLRVDALRGTGSRPDSPAADTPEEVARKFVSRKPTADAWFLPIQFLARREWDLSPKRTGTEELNEALDEVIRTDPQTRILALGEVAELWSGISYRRDDTLEVEGLGEVDTLATTLANAMRNLPDQLREQLKYDGHFPMLFRAGDLQAMTMARPKLALVNGALWEKVRTKAVAAGDVLISAGGSIGKVAVVPEWAAGDLASSSLINIRPGRPGQPLLPGYLACILASGLYQHWLSGHARGAVIQRLSIAALRDIPIPVPHPVIQERVEAAFQSHKVDAFDELLRSLSAQRTDAVTIWLEQAEPFLSGLENQTERWSEVGTLLELERGAADFLTLRDKLPPGDRESLPKWVYAAWAAAEKLRGISHVPEGMAKLTVLGNARNDLGRALSDIDTPRGGQERAKRFCLVISSVIDAQTEAIMAAVRIVPEVLTPEIQGADISRVHVVLHNRSHLPLLKFQATSPQCVGEVRLGSLDPGMRADLPMDVRAPEAGQFDFVIHWSAARLDGKSIGGELHLSIRVKSAEGLSLWSSGIPELRASLRAPESRLFSISAGEEAAISALPSEHFDLGPNPYVTGTPITRPDMFYGRSGILDSIKRHLGSTTHRNVILLEGNRRAGKSSILVQLERPEALPDWVVTRCDFQGASGDNVHAGIPTDQVFSHLAQQIAEAGLRYDFHFWPPGQDNYNPKKPYRLEFRRAFANELKGLPAFEAFKEFLDSVVEEIAPKRLLLMLDEFDRIQEGIDSGVTSPQVPQNIRYLMNNYPAVTAILTGSRRMTQMRKEYWSVLFGLGHKVGVTSIDESSAKNLVTEPVRGRLVYPPSVVERIIGLCACQPFLIQRLCSQVFDRCSQAGQATVSMAIAEDASRELVSGMEHFEAFWEFAGSDRARFILCIVYRLSKDVDAAPVTLPMIEDELNRAGVQFKRDELVGDELKKLVELELISMEKDGQYRLAVPLLALWIRDNKDYEDQRERAVRESGARSLV